MKVSTKELGELLGLTQRHIYNLEKMEILSKEDIDRWDAYKNMQAYIYYKVSIETNTTDGGKARIRRDVADAKLKEVMLAEKINKLIPIEKVAKELEDISITISNKLYAIPHKLKRRFKLDSNIENALHSEIKNTLKELKDPEIYNKLALEVNQAIQKEKELEKLATSEAMKNGLKKDSQQNERENE